MQTVILAGGLGTRIKDVAGDRPKSLIPVAGRPFIEHQFDLLRRHGLSDVLLAVGYRGQDIEGHVGDGSRFGMNVAYSYEPEDRLMGTGGALVNALSLLQDAFLVLYGDSYLPVDYGAVVKAFNVCGCPALMTVFRNEGRWDQSNTRIDKGKVVYYSKQAKPGEADYIDYGLSAWRRSVMESYRDAERPLDLARMQGDLVARGEMAAHVVTERFYEIGKPDGWKELNEKLS